MATLTGIVTEAGAPAARLVRVYDHALGELVAETTSAANGDYSVNIPAGVVDVLFIGGDGLQHLAHGPLTLID